jgi:uncharacterized protein (DUF1501 family)
MSCTEMLPRVTRRTLMGGLGAAFVLGQTKVSVAAPGGDARLVVINMRGGADGLGMIIPYGDPSLAGLRAGLVPSNMIKIDGFFALNPAMPNFYAMMQAKQGMAIHAVGPPVEVRSHFAAQDYLQNGSTGSLDTGWLNRALAVSGSSGSGLAMASSVPKLMRGTTLMPGWAPEPYNQAPTSLTGQVTTVGVADSAIGPANALGFSDRAAWNPIIGQRPNAATDLSHLALIASKLLAGSTGPRVAAMETDNFDSHDDQNDVLPAGLGAVDNALGMMQANLGSAWANTVVLTMTEFGRTAYENGTQGTDHGTAFAVLLAGGAVRGGMVMANCFRGAIWRRRWISGRSRWGC